MSNPPKITDNPDGTSAPKKDSIEETNLLRLAFGADGLLPAIVVDWHSKDILMLAYMNEEAFLKTLETGEAHYWSRSRQMLWHKGAQSGEIQIIREIRTDCDQDSLILAVEQKGGGCCHAGYKSCFYRQLDLAVLSGKRQTGPISSPSLIKTGPKKAKKKPTA